MNYESIHKIPGFKIGHAEDTATLTGCTVILCDEKTCGGVDQRGGAPGTRETDLLRPMHLVEHVNAVLLSGGSAFGLDAAAGVMRYCEDQGMGYPVGPTRVPIVPGAVLMDLTVGDHRVRPDAAMGYAACQAANDDEPKQGNVGAGTGATVGKILGMGQCMKGGIGHAALDLGGGLWIGAIIAVNALGDVVDPDSGKILAGARTISKGPIRIGEPGYFADTLSIMRSTLGQRALAMSAKTNTVIGAILTNARLTRNEANKLAQCAQNGLALTIRPAHTMFDGDTIFALASRKKAGNIHTLAAHAPLVVARAVVNAVRFAEPVGNIPAIASK
ncbi:peptidase S58 [Anaerolineaceae bacterium oral taxon 439]|nr:peptidase S58 [Anaerolineaceae bacterium oral taxon 439]